MNFIAQGHYLIKLVNILHQISQQLNNLSIKIHKINLQFKIFNRSSSLVIGDVHLK